MIQWTYLQMYMMKKFGRALLIVVQTYSSVYLVIISVMLNVNCFQLLKHLSSFSIEGIYLELLNLPYDLGFERKNLCLVCKIPDMSKDPATSLLDFDM